MSKDKPAALVTGASGFLGRHLVKHLTRNGNQVRILARKTSDLSHFSGLNVKVAKGDITDRYALLRATEDIDVVYHLAGVVAYKRAQRAMMDKVNIDGTANVIDACITNRVKKLLHLSSVVTVGANFKPEPVDEDFPFNLGPYNLGYFETKRKAEQLIEKAVKENGLAAYMINPATIYGAGDATKGSRKTQVKVAQGRFPFYPPGGVGVVPIDDVIQAIDLCLERGQPGRRYIINSENFTIKEVFKIIAETSGVRPPSYPIPRFLLSSLGWFGDTLRKMGKETSLSSETAVTASLYHWYSNERAKKELGYQPTSARKAIEASVSWMKENGLLQN